MLDLKKEKKERNFTPALKGCRESETGNGMVKISVCKQENIALLRKTRSRSKRREAKLSRILGRCAQARP